MAKQVNEDARTAGPLWIIAFALLTIAVCLVLLVIKIQFATADEDSPSKAARKNPPARPENLERPRRELAGRLAPSPPAAVEAEPEPAASETNRSSVEGIASTAEQPKRIPLPGAFAPLAGLAGTNYSTAIAGRVTLRGTPPDETPMNMDSPCAGLQANPPMTRHFVVSPDGGLADALVSIGGFDSGRDARSSTDHEIAFINCRIEPYVSVATIGQRLTFRNADEISHTPQLARPRTNFARFVSIPVSPKSLVRVPLFETQRPENFLRITCEAHPWEAAYISFLANPFFAVTDTNGSFVIPNVPPGKYTLFALHREAFGTNGIARVVVNQDKISVVNFSLDAPAR